MWDLWKVQIVDSLWFYLFISTALSTVNHPQAQMEKRRTVLESTGSTEETQGRWKPGRGLPGEVALGSEHRSWFRGISAFSRGWRQVWRMGRRSQGCRAVPGRVPASSHHGVGDGRELVGHTGALLPKFSIHPGAHTGAWIGNAVFADATPGRSQGERPQKGTKPKLRSFPRGDKSPCVAFSTSLQKQLWVRAAGHPCPLLRMSPQPCPAPPSRPRPNPPLHAPPLHIPSIP